MFTRADDRMMKEAADTRARNRDVSDALAGWFEARREITVLDVAPGIGETLRAIAPLLPPDQTWTLLAPDEAARATLRDHFLRWAPASREDGDLLKIERHGLRIDAHLLLHDARGPAALPAIEGLNLICAGADLIAFPETALRRIAGLADAKRAAVHVSCVYDGRIRFSPHHAMDGAMTAAFHRQLLGESGHGPAAGHVAATFFSEQLTLTGHSVIEGSSAVLLRGAEARLIARVQSLLGEAQRSIAKGHDKMIDGWLARQRQSVELSQTDFVALPS
ncbi:MAG: hypothetical protein NW216_09760 [Hyphomicrobium sp.]|nr:hypothetical protein [Hyphomicrobium sp.]